MFVCCKHAKPIASYEPVKHRISDENVFQRQNTQAAACFRCLPHAGTVQEQVLQSPGRCVLAC